MSPIDKHKRILIDTKFLVEAVSDKNSTQDRERIDYFLLILEKNKSKIIIPTPAIAEFLAVADTARHEFIRQLQRKSYIEIAPFDMAAAVECGLIDATVINAGDKRGGVNKPWQHIKVDRQIIAIGRVHNASLVISGDNGVCNNASRVNMDSMTIDDLPLPPTDPQGKLPV